MSALASPREVKMERLCRVQCAPFAQSRWLAGESVECARPGHSGKACCCGRRFLICMGPGSRPRNALYVPCSEDTRGRDLSAARATGPACANTNALWPDSFNARDTIDMADSVNSTGNFAS